MTGIIPFDALKKIFAPEPEAVLEPEEPRIGLLQVLDKMFYGSELPTKEFLAVSMEENKAICSGDSGGPVFGALYKRGL